MIIVRQFIVFLLVLYSFFAQADFFDKNDPHKEDSYFYDYQEIEELATDSRIKTYIYNPKEVYLLVLHFGFQSNIEFAKGERVETISLGDTYAWKITPLDNMLFIRPLEKNVRTNMTVITNKKKYQFDLVAKEFYEEEPENLMYSIRFYYPKKIRKNVKR
jgi:type IV secretion system protein VirB9